MNRYATRFTLALSALLLLSSSAYAGPLDDYYLEQFGEKKSVQLQKAILSVAPVAQGPAQCGMPIKRALRRDWKSLELSTQTMLTKQLTYPALSNEQSVLSSGGHFKVHYTNLAPNAPKINDYYIGVNLYRGLNYLTGVTSTAEWAQKVADTFEQVYNLYTATYNYQLVPYPLNNPSGPYDIYLQELSDRSFYGFTEQPTRSDGTIDLNYWVGKPFQNSASSYIVLDNDFVEYIFTNQHGSLYSPLQSLQVTAAHEYHHAIQFGYNYYFDVWYGEATSTWMENELFSTIDQLYTYAPDWLTQSKLSLDIPENLSTGGGYGRWIFNRYLAETHATVNVIRSFWEKLSGLNPATSAVNSSGDIHMAPVMDAVLSASYNSTLGTDFFGFTKRVYTRDWASAQDKINTDLEYSPLAIVPSVTLPHYSFAYYRYTPSATTPTLAIYLTKTSGIQAAVFKKVSGVITEVPVDPGETSYTISGFNSTDEVTLLIANTSTVDGHMASFSTDGNNLPVTEPISGTVYIPPSPASGGSGGACFIATAAYGSYLHPQVQLLRNFRDEYLLTTTPGRTFVTWYYRYSPPLADFIARHPTLRGITRLLLTPLVVAVAQPLISAVMLLLICGAALLAKQRRLKIHYES